MQIIKLNNKNSLLIEASNYYFIENDMLDKKIKNPETGREIKVSTALGYKDENPSLYNKVKNWLKKFSSDDTDKIDDKKENKVDSEMNKKMPYPNTDHITSTSPDSLMKLSNIKNTYEKKVDRQVKDTINNIKDDWYNASNVSKINKLKKISTSTDNFQKELCNVLIQTETQENLKKMSDIIEDKNSLLFKKVKYASEQSDSNRSWAKERYLGTKPT